MIPLKLQLRNFMCYRELDSLDFSGIHLACLAGDNGHGKSALLDAITWALWGKARAKRDDELIHLGQAEMEVEFEFALGENHYRVIRKRDSHGRGRSSLELQVRDGDLFRPLTEPTMRQTQARINRILCMDYETFINSAFLLQGRADEFTTKAPAERKRILGEILGLSLYDQCEELAKQRAKDRKSEIEQITAQVREMERELERKPQYEQELKQAQADVEKLSSTLQGAEEELRKLREEWKELDLKRAQIEELSARLIQGERELAEIEEQMATCQKRLDEYEAIINEKKFIEEGFAALTAARQLHESLNEKLSQLVKLNERKGQLEAAIADAKHALTLKQRLCSEKVGELSALAQELEALEAELTRVRAELERLGQREREREAKQQEIRELSKERASLETRNEQLKGEMDSLREKSELLQVAEAHCPLCGQGLSEENRVRLVKQFTSELAEREALHQSNRARIEELAARSQTLEQEIEAIEGELATRGALQKQEATLEKSLAEARGAAEELAKQREKLAELDERLASGKYAEAEQAELAELLGQIEGLGYDPEAHQEVRRDLEVLSRFEEDKARLKAALERIDEERANLERLRKSKARWQETLAADLAKKEALAQELTQLPDLATRLEKKINEVDELRGKEARARQVLGAARQKLDYCEYLAKEREKKLKERNRVAEEKAIYDELRLAFGKKGLQAMIIESAIPEIEDEANRLLARMTEGRMHVSFETQRETLKGDTVETLAIKISDELGTRAYELYSGGESFRVNFAIRIALSKLLARRAGARLQTLVIDEGFGTQDAQGRERLVEAINSIREDFEKILVITHIEELKDAFPVRIDVVKTPQGSQVTIS
jgi:exonuclease SbcC